MTLAAGNVYWAVVPFTPQAPFNIHVKDGSPISVSGPEQIVDALRKGGDAEFGFVVRAKARPVVLLSDRLDLETGDLLALRLARLVKMSEGDRKRIRDQREQQLFHLRPDDFPGLAEESAAMITAPVRVNETALDTRRVLGQLGRDELRLLVERFVTYWQFDLRALLRSQLHEISRRQRR